MRKSIKAITTAYYILYTEIEDEHDLRKYKLTLSDYNAACKTMEQLREPGKIAQCIIKNVAEFFRYCGYDVKTEGITYIISC